MAEDPSQPPASDASASPPSEPQNRPEPAIETPPLASESADLPTEAEAKVETQPQPTLESASIASEPPETPSPPQKPEGEAVSQSTQPVSEPPTMPPAQEIGMTETDPSKKQENSEPQATTEPQSQPAPEPPQPQNPLPSPAPSTPSPPSIPSLHYPFYGSFPVNFDFGARPTEERIKKKYEEWGIVGHNGIDFGLQEGTEVLACDEGTVIQAGDNGDFGISITIKHSWGMSIYAHLQSFGVLVNDQVKKAQVIGASGQTGFTTGQHLHFGIQPTNPDTNNGYLGYVNPTPYLKETSPLLQSPISPPSPQPPDLSVDLSEEKPSEQRPAPPAEQPVTQAEPQTPQTPMSPLSPQSKISQEDIRKQAVAMFDARVKENSVKGNQVKKVKREEALQKIFTFAQEKRRITNEQVRDLLHVSQSTASDYLSELVTRGMLKTEGKWRATVYVFRRLAIKYQ